MGSRSTRERAPACSRLLGAQLGSATVRSGEHPRGAVHRLDLLDDVALDAFRTAHPEGSGAAMDAALDVEERLERMLLERGPDDGVPGRFASRPILAVFVCVDCGASAIAPASRAWEVDRVMRRTGLGERDGLALTALVRGACGTNAPSLDALSPEAIREPSGGVGQEHDDSALRDRILELADRGPARGRRAAGGERRP